MSFCLSELLCLLLIFPFAHAEGNLYHAIHKFKTAYGAHANGHRIAHVKSFATVDPEISSPVFPPTTNLNITVAPSFQIYTSGLLPTSPAPSAACAAALTANVTCDANIQYMTYTFPSPSLVSLCTATCTASLQAYRQAVVSACSGFTFGGPNNSTHAATLAIDVISNAYRVQCLRDGTTGAFCPTLLSTYVNTNPTQGILGYPQSQLCSSCMLGTINATLSNALTFSPPLYQALQAVLAICGSAFSSYNVQVLTPSPPYKPGPASLLGSSSIGAPICALTNRIVVLSAPRSCDQLAAQFSITTMDFLASNPLLRPANCTSGIAAETSLCLPQPCTIYPFRLTQTCSDVIADVNQNNLAGGNNITIPQLQSFNPSLVGLCQLGLGARTGMNVCISPHEGFPAIGNDGGSAVPTPTLSATAAPSGPTPSGTTPACSAWYLVQPNDFCQRILMSNAITLADFQALNPQVNGDCSNLWAGFEYCVLPVSPSGQATSPLFTSSNITSGTIRMLPISTDTNVPTSTNYPSVTSVPAPPNVAKGTVTTGCSVYYTVSAGDTCESVQEFFGIDIYPGNPGVVCSAGLVVGSAICVFTFYDPCALGPTFTVLQQAFNSRIKQHFYTTDNAEMQVAVTSDGFTFQDLAAGVFTSQQPLTTPLYRLNNPTTGGHLYTTTMTEVNFAVASAGYKFEGIQAYVYPTQLCGSSPFFRLYNPTTSDHFYTMSVSEKNTAKNSQGYTVDEGSPFYVLAA
ncbi:hypothetical protein C8R44DRAFT_741977 [Mycena epipterygia]|nr:hypothetical protein C8R44DRAFT_741977 [Mycena epipterygia]